MTETMLTLMLVLPGGFETQAVREVAGDLEHVLEQALGSGVARVGTLTTHVENVPDE
jgi:hypothetical protein